MEVVVTMEQHAKLQIVTINKPTPGFFTGWSPSCRPTNSVKALKGKALKRNGKLEKLERKNGKSSYSYYGKTRKTMLTAYNF